MKYLFLILFPFLLSAQSFTVEYDYAQFKYNDTLSYFELYYSFYQNQFNIVEVENELTIQGDLNVKINNDLTGKKHVDKHFKFSNIIDTSKGVYNKTLTGSLNFVLPFGKYVCTLISKDSNNKRKIDSVSFDIELYNIPTDRIAMSDIQLASSINKSSNENSMFYKNTYEVIPNPSNIYGEALPAIFFYTELYNIQEDDPQIENPLKVTHIVANANNKNVYEKIKYFSRQYNSIVDVGSINISNYPSGTYNLIITAEDSLDKIKVLSSKKLFIYNPSIIDTTTEFLKDEDYLVTEFSIMSEEELNNYYEMSEYIATANEDDKWEELKTEEAKKTFLYNFWKARDLDKDTPVNEFKREYFARVQKANDRFGTIQKKGWKTDRGRVLIMYGEPSEIDRYPNQTNTKPYEVWNYDNIEGGVIFVFADLLSFNDYRLIHSTKRGELTDPDWLRRIREI